jgi:hypothetical protein
MVLFLVFSNIMRLVSMLNRIKLMFGVLQSFMQVGEVILVVTITRGVF